jgi:2-keto-3-deoxy-L-rhamnonate aldolase RhmA
LMIEKKSAVDQLEDILNVEGVDMIQFGPCDYSMSIGLHGEWTHPTVLEAEKKVIKTALKYDKHPRAEINSVKSAQKYIDLGVRDFSIGTDVVILYNWLKTNGEELKKALSTL